MDFDAPALLAGTSTTCDQACNGPTASRRATTTSSSTATTSVLDTPDIHTRRPGATTTLLGRLRTSRTPRPRVARLWQHLCQGRPGPEITPAKVASRGHHLVPPLQHPMVDGDGIGVGPHGVDVRAAAPRFECCVRVRERRAKGTLNRRHRPDEHAAIQRVCPPDSRASARAREGFSTNPETRTACPPGSDDIGQREVAERTRGPCGADRAARGHRWRRLLPPLPPAPRGTPLHPQCHGLPERPPAPSAGHLGDSPAMAGAVFRPAGSTSRSRPAAPARAVAAPRRQPRLRQGFDPRVPEDDQEAAQQRPGPRTGKAGLGRCAFDQGQRRLDPGGDHPQLFQPGRRAQGWAASANKPGGPDPSHGG